MLLGLFIQVRSSISTGANRVSSVVQDLALLLQQWLLRQTDCRKVWYGDCPAQGLQRRASSYHGLSRKYRQRKLCSGLNISTYNARVGHPTLQTFEQCTSLAEIITGHVTAPLAGFWMH